MVAEQRRQIGRRGGHRDPGDRELGGVERRALRREEGGLTPLGVSPQHHAIGRAHVLDVLRGAHSVENGIAARIADEVRVGGGGALPDVVGGGAAERGATTIPVDTTVVPGLPDAASAGCT